MPLPRPTRRPLHLLAAMALVLLPACESGNGVSAVLTSLDLTLGAPDVASGSSVSVAVAGRDQDGRAISLESVQWSSSSPGVATVTPTGTSSATVEGFQAGTATLTATATAGGETVSGSAAITVVPGPAENLSVAPTSATFDVGATAAFTATVTDARGNTVTQGSVTWSVSDPTVASLPSTTARDATVRGESEGSATLVADVGVLSATASLTVEGVEPVPTDIEIGSSATSFDALGATSQLQATVRDQNGNPLDLPVTWSSSNESVVTVDEQGLVTTVGNGTASVEARSGELGAAVSLTVQQAVDGIEFVAVPSEAQARAPMDPPVQVAVVDRNGFTVELDVALVVTLSLASNPTGAALTGDIQRVTENGVVTFTGVAIDKEGTSFQLRARGGGLEALSDGGVVVGPNTSEPYLALSAVTWGGEETAHGVIQAGGDADLGTDIQIWNGSDCPDCLRSFVFGYGAVSTACGFQDNAGPAPGVSFRASGLIPRPDQLGALPEVGTFQLRGRLTDTDTCQEGFGVYDSEPPPSPEAAFATLSVTDEAQLTGIVPRVELQGGGRLAVTGPGGTVEALMFFTLWNPPTCADCQSQLVVGVAGDAQECLFSGNPGVAPGFVDDQNIQLTVPTAPGVYEIRHEAYQEAGCLEAQAAFEANRPGPHRTLGVIIVPETGGAGVAGPGAAAGVMPVAPSAGRPALGRGWVIRR